ncbi:substrate-binding periplasmic protein [Enterovibrio norvegicus]|uniref:substrate-binding periplasmic protein n=1 Tax=Enterovibrio norvegicus TaxID=188144 RepID=UPI001F5261D9|nr:transporter substrate-binding domain-containing protein [Enterovibrio norvegicus]
MFFWAPRFSSYLCNENTHFIKRIFDVVYTQFMALLFLKRMKLKTFLYALVCYSLIFVSSLANAKDQDAKRFVVGVQNFHDYSPYSSFVDNTYSGFNRELLDAFAQDYGYEFVYMALPIKRLYRHFLDGAVDFKYPDNAKWSATQKEGHNILYSDPIVSFVDGVIVLNKNKPIQRNALSKLGMIAGFTPLPYLKDIKEKHIEVFETRSLEPLLKMLATGRIDGIYTNLAVMRNQVSHQDNQAPMSMSQTLPHVTGTRHLSTKLYPGMIVEFNQFLKQNRKRVNEIKQKHGLL